MVYEGTAYWASVTTPNTRFEPKYTIDLVVDEDTAEQLRTSGITIKDKEETKLFHKKIKAMYTQPTPQN